MEEKKKVGRPRKKDSEKIIYQRVPLRYETYNKLKEKSNLKKLTFSDYLECLLNKDI